MIRKLHFRIPLTVIITLLAILLSSGIAKTVTPEQKDKKEILIIGEKRRTYYQLHNNKLNYHPDIINYKEAIVKTLYKHDIYYLDKIED